MVDLKWDRTVQVLIRSHCLRDWVFWCGNNGLGPAGTAVRTRGLAFFEMKEPATSQVAHCLSISSYQLALVLLSDFLFISEPKKKRLQPFQSDQFSCLCYVDDVKTPST